MCVTGPIPPIPPNTSKTTPLYGFNQIICWVNATLETLQSVNSPMTVLNEPVLIKVTFVRFIFMNVI